jgi:hypothetical protein
VAERWNSPRARILPWTPIERGERDRIIGALADVLALPTGQVNYSRVADLLGMTRSTLFSRLEHYQLPRPALVRTLTPSEHERIAEIRRACGDDRDQLRMATMAFIEDVWARSSKA